MRIVVTRLLCVLLSVVVIVSVAGTILLDNARADEPSGPYASTITLHIYKLWDGGERATVTVRYVENVPGPGGVPATAYVDILPAYVEVREVGSAYSYPPQTIANYTFSHCDLNGFNQPSGTVQSGGITVVMVYVKPVTLIYDANGGVGAPPAQAEVRYAFASISSAVPSLDGYSFTGWNTAADGSGDGYAPGTDIWMLDDTILYAQWQQDVPVTEYWAITYHSNYDSTILADVDYTVQVPRGSTYTIEDMGYGKSGFLFEWYNTHADGLGTGYLIGQPITPTTDMDLYARWSPVI